jgi:diguanylate cyclase (GGDEF)-like protein
MLSSTPKAETLLGIDLDWVSSYEQAVGAFADCAYDAYLIDFRLGPRNGLDLLREPFAQACDKPIIMLTGYDDYAVDMAAMSSGAADYLVKGQLTVSLLERSIRYALERRQVQRDLQKLVEERTRDFALLEQHAQEMNALQKATASLLSTLDLSLLIGQILDAAQEAIPAAERAQLCLLDQPGERSSRFAISLDDPRIYRMQQPDAQDEPILASLLPDEELRRTVRSAVIAPLIRGGEFFGALSLTSSQPSAFSAAAQRLLTSFAATATAAMHNAMLYSEIQSLATTDSLTGHFNRRTFFELGQREIDRAHRFGHPLSAIMLDVDWFKTINDTYGHPAGDQVLIGIVDRCCRVIRHVDILARYGGDEFAILLPEADSRLAGDIAERIRLAVSSGPVMTEAGQISASISLGIAQTSPETGELGMLLKQADAALYRSKQAGKDRVTVFVVPSDP